MEREPLLVKQEKPLLDTQHNSIPSSLFTYLYVGHFFARWGARFISHFLSLLCLQLHSHCWVFLLYFFINNIYIFWEKNTCAKLTSLLKIHNNFNILRLRLEIFETKVFYFTKILRLKLVLVVVHHFLLGLLNLKLFHCYCDILKIKSFNFNVLELFQTV